MTLSAQTVEALLEALEDEYRARATYRKVIEAFGPAQPFVNIAEAEDRHVRSLVALLERHGVAAPPDDWPDRVTAPESVEAACAAGVEAEIENDAMYRRLLAVVTEPDARSVMENLRAASQDRHLPAFRRCLARQGDAGGRRRRRRGGRPGSA
jgi:hypothetical protein